MTSSITQAPPIPSKWDIIPAESMLFLIEKHRVYALIDKEDYETVARFNWSVHMRDGAFYARDGRKVVYMHRLIFRAPDGIEVDHKNCDTQDNRKSNLRLATRSQQIANRRKEVNRVTSSKFKGVTWLSTNKRWMAQIKINGHYKYLGSFINEEDAAKAYDVAATNAFVEFARTNF